MQDSLDLQTCIHAYLIPHASHEKVQRICTGWEAVLQAHDRLQNQRRGTSAVQI